MTNTPALTEQQIDEIDAAIAAYQQHPEIGFACCSAHPAADAAAALLTETRRLRDKAREYGELAARREAQLIALRAQLAATRTKVIATEADEIVAHCPDHGSRDGVWITCHCDVADDMRRRTLTTPAV